ncbi:Sentrin-specific protease 6 [Quaeritorhiza haematococci]|nr:Sentrin-specific protease 6 [Quaeritorhiza haematococci]
MNVSGTKIIFRVKRDEIELERVSEAGSVETISNWYDPVKLQHRIDALHAVLRWVIADSEFVAIIAPADSAREFVQRMPRIQRCLVQPEKLPDELMGRINSMAVDKDTGQNILESIRKKPGPTCGVGSKMPMPAASRSSISHSFGTDNRVKSHLVNRMKPNPNKSLSDEQKDRAGNTNKWKPDLEDDEDSFFDRAASSTSNSVGSIERRNAGLLSSAGAGGQRRLRNINDRTRLGTISSSRADSEMQVSTRKSSRLMNKESGRTSTDTVSPYFGVKAQKSGEMFVFPFGEKKNAVSVRWEDWQHLDPGEFLNDTVIEFYLRYLMLNKLQKSLADQVYIFNTFFYQQLTRKGDKEKGAGLYRIQYERVKKWTSKVDIFKKRFVFVPINENLHWYLVVIYNPGALLPSANTTNTIAEDSKEGASNPVTADSTSTFFSIPAPSAEKEEDKDEDLTDDGPAKSELKSTSKESDTAPLRISGENSRQEDDDDGVEEVFVDADEGEEFAVETSVGDVAEAGPSAAGTGAGRGSGEKDFVSSSVPASSSIAEPRRSNDEILLTDKPVTLARARKGLEWGSAPPPESTSGLSSKCTSPTQAELVGQFIADLALGHENGQVKTGAGGLVGSGALSEDEGAQTESSQLRSGFGLGSSPTPMEDVVLQVDQDHGFEDDRKEANEEAAQIENNMDIDMGIGSRSGSNDVQATEKGEKGDEGADAGTMTTFPPNSKVIPGSANTDADVVIDISADEMDAVADEGGVSGVDDPAAASDTTISVDEAETMETAGQGKGKTTCVGKSSKKRGVSTAGSQKKQADPEKLLQGYLKNEARTKLGVEIEAQPIKTYVKCPKQPNYWDCGIYLLHIAETFLDDVEEYSKICVLKSEYRFPQEKSVNRKRKQLQELMVKLQGRYEEMIKFQKQQEATSGAGGATDSKSGEASTSKEGQASRPEQESRPSPAPRIDTLKSDQPPPQATPVTTTQLTLDESPDLIVVADESKSAPACTVRTTQRKSLKPTRLSTPVPRKEDIEVELLSSPVIVDVDTEQTLSRPMSPELIPQVDDGDALKRPAAEDAPVVLNEADSSISPVSQDEDWRGKQQLPQQTERNRAPQVQKSLPKANGWTMSQLIDDDELGSEPAAAGVVSGFVSVDMETEKETEDGWNVWGPRNRGAMATDAERSDAGDVTATANELGDAVKGRGGGKSSRLNISSSIGSGRKINKDVSTAFDTNPDQMRRSSVDSVDMQIFENDFISGGIYGRQQQPQRTTGEGRSEAYSPELLETTRSTLAKERALTTPPRQKKQPMPVDTSRTTDSSSNSSPLTPMSELVTSDMSPSSVENLPTDARGGLGFSGEHTSATSASGWAREKTATGRKGSLVIVESPPTLKYGGGSKSAGGRSRTESVSADAANTSASESLSQESVILVED